MVLAALVLAQEGTGKMAPTGQGSSPLASSLGESVPGELGQSEPGDAQALGWSGAHQSLVLHLPRQPKAAGQLGWSLPLPWGTGCGSGFRHTGNSFGNSSPSLNDPFKRQKKISGFG